MRIIHLVYSVPDLDSRDCDRRIEQSIRLELTRIPYRLEACAELLRQHSQDFGAEVEYLEVWKHGVRVDVVYPTPEESFT